MGLINFNDPASIRRWVLVWPERHAQVVRWMHDHHPQFRGAIEAAMKGRKTC